MCANQRFATLYMYLYSSVCEISSQVLRSFFAGVAKILRTPLMLFLLFFGLFFTKNTIIFLVKFLFIVGSVFATFAHINFISLSFFNTSNTGDSSFLNNVITDVSTSPLLDFTIPALTTLLGSGSTPLSIHICS